MWEQSAGWTDHREIIILFYFIFIIFYFIIFIILSSEPSRASKLYSSASRFVPVPGTRNGGAALCLVFADPCCVTTQITVLGERAMLQVLAKRSCYTVWKSCYDCTIVRRGWRLQLVKSRWARRRSWSWSNVEDSAWTARQDRDQSNSTFTITIDATGSPDVVQIGF